MTLSSQHNTLEEQIVELSLPDFIQTDFKTI